MRTFRPILIFSFCLFASSLFAQDKMIFGGVHQDGKKIICNAVVENGDTLAYLSLQEITINDFRVFRSVKEKQQWNRLKRDVKKVYPYAVLASIKLKEFDANLATMKTDIEKDIYMKKAEKELKKQFEKELQDLSLTQGRILIRLIDRETSTTSYKIVKQLRGGFSAFMWQSLAVLFNSSLKSTFDPSKGEDQKIEQIIHLVENNQI